MCGFGLGLLIVLVAVIWHIRQLTVHMVSYTVDTVTATSLAHPGTTYALHCTAGSVVL